MEFFEQFLLMLQLLQLTFITREPSCVISVGKADLHVATGNGVLAIEYLQPAGKKPMHVADFFNGHKLVTGQMLSVPAG